MRPKFSWGEKMLSLTNEPWRTKATLEKVVELPYIVVMKWIEEERGIVPTDFNIAVENLTLSIELKEATANLLESKRAGNELDKDEKISAISNFIESELARWENSEIPKSIVASHGSKLDEFFRESIKEVW